MCSSWLAYDAGCPPDASAAASAALNGKLHILQWLQAHGCKKDKSLRNSAAEGGQIEVLKWARANGIEMHLGSVRIWPVADI